VSLQDLIRTTTRNEVDKRMMVIAFVRMILTLILSIIAVVYDHTSLAILVAGGTVAEAIMWPYTIERLSCTTQKK
jgi:phage-related holin